MASLPTGNASLVEPDNIVPQLEFQQGLSRITHETLASLGTRLCFEVISSSHLIYFLLGHGSARCGEVHIVTALVDELRPLFPTAPTGEGRPYDDVVGHSLGGIVTAVILPLLASSTPVRVVLVDPPLELAPETVAMHRERLLQRLSLPVQTPEEILRENPRWTREDAVMNAASMALCGPEVVGAIFDQNVPWSFTHYLSSVPENVQVTVLAADPALWPCIREENVNSRAYPRVEARTVRGASHLIPREVPEVVIEAALELGEGKIKREGEDIQAEKP